MMTVKHVRDGREMIYPAPFGVEYVGPFAECGAVGPHLSILKNAPQAGLGQIVQRLYGGHAYVMNEAGQTVGSYGLGDAPNVAIAAAS